MAKVKEIEEQIMKVLNDGIDESSIENTESVLEVSEEKEEVVEDAIEATKSEENVTEVVESEPVKEEEQHEEEIIEVDEVSEEQPKAEEYKPNLKYSVKGNEFDFDDWAKELITSKEREEKFRDIFTKLKGFDEIKVSRDKTKEEYDAFKNNEYLPIKEKFDNLSQEQVGWRYFEDVVARNDSSTLLNLLANAGIDEQKLAYALADRLSMSPQEKEAQRLANVRQYEKAQVEKSNNELNQKFVKQSNDLLSMQYKLAAMNYKDIIEKYNTVLNDQEAFLKEVKKEGLANYDAEKDIDIPVEQAIENVVRKIKVFMPQESNVIAAQPKAEAQIQSKPPVAIKKRIVVKGQENSIPNVGNSSADSPIGKIAKSIEDLEKISEEYYNTK